MEPWLNPLYDADGMRAIDGWAIEEQGVPSLELMEAAGREVATAVGDLAPEGPIRVVCGKGNNAGDGLVAGALPGRGRARGRGAAALARRGAERRRRRQPRALPGRAARRATRRAAAGRVRRGRRRDLRDRVLRRAAASPPPPRSRRSTAAGRRSSPATSPPASTPPVARSRARRSRRRSRSASTPPSSATGSRRGSGTPASCGWSPIGIPDGAPSAPAAGEIEAAVLDLAPRRGPHSTKFSSGQVTIAGGSRGLTGAVQMSSRGGDPGRRRLRDRRRPRRPRGDLRGGPARGDVRRLPRRRRLLAPGSAKALLRAFERAAAGVLGPGLGRDPASVELAREVDRRDRGAAGHRRRRAQRVRRQLERIAARDAPTILTPHAGELGRLLELDSDEIAAHRARLGARGPPRRAGAVVVLKGDDTIVTDGERVAVNALSAPALATAGTGDVLSGIVAALLARGLEPFAAACAGVLAHARAGNDAAERIGAASRRSPPT